MKDQLFLFLFLFFLLEGKTFFFFRLIGTGIWKDPKEINSLDNEIQRVQIHFILFD